MKLSTQNQKAVSHRGLRILLIVAALLTATVCQARPPFLELYKTYYKLDPDSPNGKAGCKNCHSEGTRRNSYGKSLSKLVKMSDNGRLTEEMLQKVESEDSDGDGWTNVDEIKQGYLPGDPASHPPGKPGDPPGPKPWAHGGGGGSLIPNHAFHPAIVHFPIALFLFALVLEILGKRRSSEEMSKAAFWNLCASMLSLIVVVPTGVGAWLLGGHKLEGTMLIHLILACTSVVLMGLSLAMRKKQGVTQAYIALLILASIAIIATGHFGGLMVYG